MKRLLLAMCLLVSASSAASRITQACPVVDLMPTFWSVVDRTAVETQVAPAKVFRKAILDEYPQLYGPEILRMPSATAFDREIEDTVRDTRKNREAIESVQHYLASNLSAYLAEFQHTFPDFKCDFTIYLMPSLGHFDGMGHVVAGRPALLLGVDTISDFHQSNSSLKIFVEHELFHRYHWQVAGMSDDLSEREVLWRGLWAEGLATYVSMRMNPGSSLQDALFVPKDLVERAHPQLNEIVADLMAHLDEVEPRLYSRYFDFGGTAGKLPPRSGYYVGCLVAQALGRKHSLFDLAHMKGPKLRSAIRQTLGDLAHE